MSLAAGSENLNNRMNNCSSPSSFSGIDEDLIVASNQQLHKNYSDHMNSTSNGSFNSSGLGDSILMPCHNMLGDSSANTSSIYNNNNGSYSGQVTPTSPSNSYNNDSSSGSSKINVNAPIFSMSSTQQKNSSSSGKQPPSTLELINKIAMSNLSLNNQQSQQSKASAAAAAATAATSSTTNQNENSSKSSIGSNHLNLPFSNLTQQMSNLNMDYNPFSDYMGIDKMILQMAANGLEPNGQKKSPFDLSGIDPQQQQQFLAQVAAAAAAAAAASNSNDSSFESRNQSGNSSFNTARSVTENIEVINSKFMNQKNQFHTNNSSGNNENSSSINSLLAIAAAAAANNNDNYSYNSPNLPVNLKRQSYPLSNQQQMNHFQSSQNNNSNSSLMQGSAASSSSRLNSTPNLFNSMSALVNEQNMSNRSQTGHSQEKQQMSGSLSASNSGFNFNMNTSGNNGMNDNQQSVNNSSCYDDDDVFPSANNSFSSASVNQANNSSNNSNANNFDAATLAQIYRNLVNSNGANGNNANINEILSNLILLNNSNNNNNNSNNGNNNGSFSTSGSQAALKQRHTASLSNRLSNISGSNASSMSNPSNTSNIAALTSVTSNIASLLNINNNSNQNMQQQQFNNADSNLKRRLNSNTFNMGNSGNSGSNVSGMLNTGSANSSFGNSNLPYSNIGPNASHILQNSSMASSARLHISTSSSAAASVLGNNSSLHATLGSLPHQSGNSSSASHNNQHLFGSSGMSGAGSLHQSNLLNFNMSPSSPTNHGILSALSLSSTAGSSLQNQLLSASGKPLRSERLPSHIVEDIVKQAKIRRRNGGKKEVCVFCRNNGEKEQIYTSHTLKDASNHVACPILRLYQCPICHASGDQAHTIKYCPYAEKDSNCIKLFKENGRMSAQATFLMNSLAGGNTSPSLSPPATPSPLSQTPQTSHLNSLMHQNKSSQQDLMNLSGHSSHFNLDPLAAYMSGFNMNKSFSNCTSSNAAAANAANSILTSNGNSSLLSSNFSNNLNK